MAQGWSRYESRGELAATPSGRVYVAFDKDANRQVAIKEISAPLLAVPGFLERFRSDAALMTRVQSPNCVQVFEFFEQDGRAFLVQEYVEAATLRDTLGAVGRLRPEQAAGLMKGALSGLGYAHAAGVLHRDLRPETVLVDRAGVPRLTDFGQPPPVEGMAAGIAGTPAYMSPEQATGQAVDARADLYSGGVVLFELLTGRLPYQGATPAEVLRMHAEAPIPDPRQFAPELPDDVAFLVGRSLTKDPATRPADALAFYNELVAAAAAGYGADWEARSSLAGVAPVTAGAIAMTAAAAPAAPALAVAPIGPGAPVTVAPPVAGPTGPPPRLRPLRFVVGLALGTLLLLGGLGYGGSHEVLPVSLASASFGVFQPPPAAHPATTGAAATGAARPRPAPAAGGASNTMLVLDVSGSMSSAAVIPQGFPKAAELKQKQDAFGSLVEQVKGGKKIPIGALIAGVSGVVDLIQLQKELDDYLTARGTDPATISKLAALKVSATGLLTALAAEQQDLHLDNHAGLVKFSDSAAVIAPLGADFNSEQSVIAGLQTEGSTNMGDGLQNALQLLNGQRGGNIVLLTDGWNNTGMTNDEVLSGPVAAAATRGIPVCTIGLGESPSDVDQALLSDIASRTGGDYYFVGDRVSLGADMLACHHAETGRSVLDFHGRVNQGQAVKVPAMTIPAGRQRLGLTLYWPGSTVDLVVRDPDGRTVGEQGYGVSNHQPGLVALSVEHPPAGRWTIEVHGTQVSSSGEDFFVSGAVDGTTPTQHFDSVKAGSGGATGPFTDLRNRFRLAITLSAIIAGVAMLLMTIRGMARRLRAKRIRRRLPGKFLVPALLYLSVVGGLAVLVVAAAANYLWETPLIQPPPI